MQDATITCQFTHEWIKDDAALSTLCESLNKLEAVAIDTEFMRSDTFYPIAALFQIADGARCYLIDPLTIKDFFPLTQLLLNSDVVKVFHSCSEDLDVFKHFLGTVPAPIFDTQLAAALLNDGVALSYSALVKQEADVELPKDETRSNWLSRPLRPQQEQYAALDVVYLLPIYQQLQQRLLEQKRLAWLQEDCADLVANAAADADLDDYYKKIKSAWKLDGKQQALLRALSLWREQTARRVDKPRNHVVYEKLLWEVAKTMPRDLDSIKCLMNGPWSRHRKWAQELWQVCQQWVATDSQNDASLVDPPLPPHARELVKKLKAIVADRSAQLNLPAEVLAKKNDIESIVRSGLNGGAYQLPARLQGWRRQVIGQVLLQAANEFVAGKKHS